MTDILVKNSTRAAFPSENEHILIIQQDDKSNHLEQLFTSLQEVKKTSYTYQTDGNLFNTQHARKQKWITVAKKNSNLTRVGYGFHNIFALIWVFTYCKYALGKAILPFFFSHNKSEKWHQLPFCDMKHTSECLWAQSGGSLQSRDELCLQHPCTRPASVGQFRTGRRTDPEGFSSELKAYICCVRCL